MAWKVPFTYICVSGGLFKLESFCLDETGAVAVISLLFVKRVWTGVFHIGNHFLKECFHWFVDQRFHFGGFLPHLVHQLPQQGVPIKINLRFQVCVCVLFHSHLDASIFCIKDFNSNARSVDMGC